MRGGLSTKQKIGRVGVTIAIGAALISGCGYIGKRISPDVSGFLHQPKTAIVQTIDSAVIGLDPGVYMDAASDYINGNQERITPYNAQVSEFVHVVNDADLLSNQDEMYLFSTNAEKVPVERGIQVCEEEVIGRASQERQLEHILKGVEETDVHNYSSILGGMAERVGDEIYKTFQELIHW